MNRFRLKTLFLLLFIQFFVTLAKAEEVPVLLMLRSSEQSDTSGCNFVQQLTALVYKEITENRIKLWDSPAKEIQITGSTLREIEKNSNTSFLEEETVFMYELWENNRREIVTKTVGFSFTNRNGSNDEVSYGYVDYKDLNELFLKSKINTNANGVYSSTYTTYVLSKNFAFNIVQFAGKAVKSTGESDDIRKTFVRNLHFNESLLGYYPPDKYINYIIDSYSESTDPKSLNSKNFLKTIETYLSQNEEMFYNMGGDRIASYLQKNKIKVTRIEVNEMWRKGGESINFEPRSMIIYVNDSALNELSARAISDMEVTINEKTITQFLQEKNFNMIITKINSQVIKRKDSYLYYKALMTDDWKRVIEFVINY